jgi:hypothetical protein
MHFLTFGRNAMRKNSLSGKINVGCLVITLLLIVGGYVGFEFGRIYLSKYILNRKILEIAGDASKMGQTGRMFPDERSIADAILVEIEKLSIDIPYDDILVDRDKQYVTINVTWEGDIVIPAYTYHFVFHLEEKRKIVY